MEYKLNKWSRDRLEIAALRSEKREARSEKRNIEEPGG
jgi:hypothetical protein